MLKLFFNPLRLFLPILILALSFPLALLATFTTTIAFVALSLRISIVYFDLGLAIITSWLLSFAPSPPQDYTYTSSLPKTPLSSGNTTPRHRSSMKSLVASPSNSSSYTSLLLSHAPADRDYEGVGGWRTPSASTDAAYAVTSEEEDAAWTKINARLELPVTSSSSVYHGGLSPSGTRTPRRHHVRSLSGHGVRIISNVGRSPAISRDEGVGSAGYFGSVGAVSNLSLARRESVGLVMSEIGDKRPKSMYEVR